jgi:8-oxo-dGTP diphosphatase
VKSCCEIRTFAPVDTDCSAPNLDFAASVVIWFCSIDDSTNLDGAMARGPVLAAGGIVLRREQPPLIAVVRLRKRDEWVLPKGKLDDGETPLAAAKREVLEETGHDVTVHEFLGTLVYEISGRSKVVHYWRMEACGGQTHELMNDIRAVDWLPLDAALARLSRSSERAFLANVGPQALQSLARQTSAKAQASRKRRARTVVAPGPLSPRPSPPGSLPIAVPAAPAHADEIAPSLAASAGEAAADEVVMDASMVAEPALQAMASDAAAPMVQAEAAPQAEVPVATADAAAPAALVEAEPVPASAAGVADGRRWSLAQKVRDWLGLAA